MKIDVTEEQYKAFQNGESVTLVPPKKEYVIEYKRNNAYFVDTTCVGVGYEGTSGTFLTHGRYRKTKENAKYTIKRNQRANRLEALVEDLQGELGIGAYCKIKWGGDEFYQRMLVNTYEKICELLNSGQYSLEG